MAIGTAGDRVDRPGASLFVFDPGLSRFAGVLLAYVTAIAALATLSPFDFSWAYRHGYELATTRSDVALNLGLLFPSGFLWRLARRGRGWPLCLDALLLGALFSAAVESLQMFLPSRVPSPTDVATNALGAWAGAAAHSQLGPWLDRRLQKQLSLHLPLANILYLLVPLCSLDALCLSSRLDCLLVLPLAAFMALLAAGLYRHRLLGTQRSFATRYAAAIGALFALGYLPILAHDPLVWAMLSVVTALLTRGAIAIGLRLPNSERRFVLATIRRALPCFLLFMVALVCRSWLQASNGGSLDLAAAQSEALLLLRDVAAFTLLGYLVSELHARSPLPAREVLVRCGATAALFAIALVAVQHMLSRDLAKAVLTLGLLACAGLAGGVIHRFQLSLVRSWGQSMPPPH